MRIRGEDAKNLAVIAVAGAAGLLGTMFVVAAAEFLRPSTSGPAPPPPPPPSSVRHILVPPTPSLRTEGRRIHIRMKEGGSARGSVSIRGSSAVPGIDGISAVPGAPRPIVYIDGIRVNGIHSDMDPATIERIEVIKGPAAKAIYGEEAADGVIEIITKGAKDGADEQRRRRRGRR